MASETKIESSAEIKKADAAGDERKFYTVCFEGDVRSMAKNIFQMVGPFGTVIVVGTGNEFEESDKLRAAIAKATS